MKKYLLLKTFSFWYIYLRSVQEKEDNIKTVESLLEKGLIEVATKEDELKVQVCREGESEPAMGWLICIV